MPFIPTPTPPPQTGWVVTAPLVIVYDDTGRLLYLYAGVKVPDNIPVAALTRLAGIGYIGRG